MNPNEKTPSWQKSPGVFFVYVGGLEDLNDFLTYHQVSDIHKVYLSVSHHDSSWWDKKLFRRRKEGTMKFPFSHEDNIHRVALPLTLNLSQKRNFLFNLDLLKEDLNAYAIVIPSSQKSRLEFVLNHLNLVVESDDGHSFKDQGQEISLREWNEWHWRRNNPKIKVPFFMRFRNHITGILIVMWVLWPQFYHQTVPVESVIESVRHKKTYRYYNITQYNQLRRVLRSYLFQEGYAFHQSGELKTVLRDLSESMLDSAQLNKLDWDKEKVKAPIGELILNPLSDSLHHINKLKDFEMKAYQEWVKLLNDSLAYPTDYFWEGDETHRLHRGIDIAGRMDTRIHSPISGRAIIGESERAGRFVAVANESKIVFFAHCDKYLFLDGEEVRIGDPVATVGLTGHTTGPHVHIGAGILDKKGPHTLGKYKFDYQDPVAWIADLK